MVDSLKGLFQQSTADPHGNTPTASWASRPATNGPRSTHLTTQTRGAESGAYTTAVVANQNTGNTLAVVTGTGAGNAGDVFTIAGVYRVHPETKISSGILQQFVLTCGLRRRRRQHGDRTGYQWRGRQPAAERRHHRQRNRGTSRSPTPQAPQPG